MRNATSDYYIKHSEIELGQISMNFTDLVNYVTTICFPEDQMTNFTNFINFQQGAALKGHTSFIADLHKITINN